MSLNNGRVAVKIVKEEYNEDITLENEIVKDVGIVHKVGKPCFPIYSRLEMVLYHLFGINPCPLKEGQTVLLPSMSKQRFSQDGEEYIIFYQDDIPLIF